MVENNIVKFWLSYTFYLKNNFLLLQSDLNTRFRFFITICWTQNQFFHKFCVVNNLGMGRSFVNYFKWMLRVNEANQRFNKMKWSSSRSEQKNEWKTQECVREWWRIRTVKKIVMGKVSILIDTYRYWFSGIDIYINTNNCIFFPQFLRSFSKHWRKNSTKFP